MNFKKTIENIRSTCASYIEPDLLSFIISDDYLMGTNNILDIEGYDIENEDNYEERLIKIHKSENLFIPLGMMTFMPILNECDLFSTKDYNLKLTPDEFEKLIEKSVREEIEKYSDEQEKLFGFLIKKDSDEDLLGKTDTCSCSIDASFQEFEKTDSEFFKTIEKIADEKIIN